jgi:transglutaminase-like putative cysteine protease/predicted outer membrane protein
MGSEARARLGLAALLTVTLMGFSRVYAGGDYPGPILLGMLLAIGIAILARRIGLVVWATIVASVAALGWYLMLIFESSRTFFGLPTIGAAIELVREAGRAYELSTLDYAPVPLRPGYMILSVASMWLLATVGEIATFRWRRPLIPAITATALFSFLLITGIPAGGSFFAVLFLLGLLTYLGLESAHRLQSWGRWVTVWADRRWDSEVTIAPLARRMGVSVLAAAIAAPLFLPAIGDGIFQWRNPTGPGLGSGRIDTLVSLAPKLIQQTDTVLFRVRAERPAYWRLVTLTHFDGNSWHPEFQRSNLSNNRVAADVPAPVPGDTLLQTYDIEGLEGDQLPAAALPETIVGEGSNASEFEGALEFNPNTGDLETSTPLSENTAYRVQSLVPDVSFEDMTEATVPSQTELDSIDRTFLTTNIYQVPTAFCPDPNSCQENPDQLRRTRIYKIAHRWTRDAKSPFEKMLALQNRFRGRFTHQLPGPTEVRGDVEVEPSASADYLVQFLTRNRVGYCQQFATAFAVLARMLGFPARVSVGFLPGETNIDSPNRFTVRGNDAHAWPEIYFNEVGWVQFEPTPRSEAPPPAYTQARLPGQGVNPPEVQSNVNRAQRGQQDAENQRRARGVREPRSEREAERRRDEAWRRAFLRLASVAALLVLLFLLSVPSIKAWLKRRRYTRARGANGTTHAAFADFEQEAADLASARRPAESPNAYVIRLVAEHEVDGRPAHRLAHLSQEAAYAPAPVTDAQAAEARRLARALRRDLWSRATWWERTGRLFSPAIVLEKWSSAPPANGGESPQEAPSRSGSRPA